MSWIRSNRRLLSHRQPESRLLATDWFVVVMTTVIHNGSLFGCVFIVLRWSWPFVFWPFLANPAKWDKLFATFLDLVTFRIRSNLFELDFCFAVVVICYIFNTSECVSSNPIHAGCFLSWVVVNTPTLCPVKNGPARHHAINMSNLKEFEWIFVHLISNIFLKWVPNFVEKYYSVSKLLNVECQ